MCHQFPQAQTRGAQLLSGDHWDSGGDDATGGWLPKCFLVEAVFSRPPYVPRICLATCLQTGSHIYAQGG